MRQRKVWRLAYAGASLRSPNPLQADLCTSQSDNNLATKFLVVLD